jgi:hypothetical protein
LFPKNIDDHVAAISTPTATPPGHRNPLRNVPGRGY